MTTITEMPRLAAVLGASGFVGRHVVRALTKRGWRVRAASRNAESANFLIPIGNMGQVVPVLANIRNRASLERLIDGADFVVNLVGIMNEGRRQTFDAVQRDGAGAVAELARAAGAGLVHVSAIGADAASPVGYARTKAEGEAAVSAAFNEAAILRPSIVFGPEDDFFNRFANMARFSPALPLIGGGLTRFQPVYVGDVAEVVARLAEGAAPRGRTYELGGPEVLTFRECMERTLETIGRKRLLLPIPWGVAGILGSVGAFLPGAPLTADQVTMLKSDNVVSDLAEREGRTLAGLGIAAQSLEATLPSYLWRYRVTGQFSARGASRDLFSQQ
jgi:uncharacterized protein YbjT (DUF2867 family)